MEYLIIFFISLMGFIIFAWSGYELGKKVNKTPEIPESQALPDTVRLWDVDWNFGRDIVARRVNVYGDIYINSKKIKVIVSQFNDDDVDYNIRCAEKLIDNIYKNKKREEEIIEHPNLEDLWHDTSEKPNQYEFILFEYVSNRDELKYFANYVTKGSYGMLKEFEKFGKCRWAYISDLLPKKDKKGGEK